FNSGAPISESNPRFIRDQFMGCDGKTPNVICPDRFSKLAQNYLNYVGNTVFPNSAGAPGTFAYVNNNYRSFAGSSLFPWTKWSVKIDHNFNERHKISGLYNYGFSEVLARLGGIPAHPPSGS